MGAVGSWGPRLMGARMNFRSALVIEGRGGMSFRSALVGGGRREGHHFQIRTTHYPEVRLQSSFEPKVTQIWSQHPFWPSETAKI